MHDLGGGHYHPAQLSTWTPPKPKLAEWTQRLKALHTLVAKAHGELAGFLSYRPDGHIDLLYEAQAHARRGIATRLGAWAQALRLAAGFRELSTEASLVARPFFERQGFVVHATQGVERRGSMLRRYAMRKQICAAEG